MSSYFTIPSSQKKRKRSTAQEPAKKQKNLKNAVRSSKHALKKPPRDESISGSEDESDNDMQRKEFFDVNNSEENESSEIEEETAAERRLKLAQQYLENIRTEVDDIGFDAEKIDRDLIAERLLEDSAESKGLLYRRLAAGLDLHRTNYTWAKWNSDTVTSVATCAPWAYTVTHDIGLAKWKIQELPENQWVSKRKGYKKKTPKPPPKRKPEQVAFTKGNKHKSKDKSYQGHVDKILTVAASQDGKYVVTGGEDNKIIVWDAETLKCLRVFTQHRDSVTSLAFRRGTNQLYSSSKDRTIKIWSLDELAYVDTLFGHQDEVMDISALAQERCVSVGARDRTARLWKVVEETQLVFRGGGGESKSKTKKSRNFEGSMDRIAMIDEEMFVTGSDNGSISLWVIHKKKPIFTMPLCHGIEPPLLYDEASAEINPSPKIIPEPQPRWITALATIPYSDVVFSGSWDGVLRVWKVSEDKKKLEAVGIIDSGTSDDANTTKIVDCMNESDLNNSKSKTGNIKGLINDISVFERGDRGRDGVCVIAAVGKENRLGRWQKVGAKNGAIVFEIPYVKNYSSV
ncbi:putative WD repeat-containing protein C2E1P5.05 [Golovinomyces cichoracearum]|uniref:Putative WD repeat-containing protein C2E1P5.05 n=1 Tax=Golovinomyces cichoracearum TaxID=62708 RepID=A0A420IF68_9PEZI|nr:putative WD repeat-containing protein C2E1P5.05 [Golovinomyces cichoracearum]